MRINRDPLIVNIDLPRLYEPVVRPTRIWANMESCIFANCDASVFPAPPPPQAIARRPCRRSRLHSRARRVEQRLKGEANAALAEGREDGGEGAGDEGISFGIAYGFLYSRQKFFCILYYFTGFFF